MNENFYSSLKSHIYLKNISDDTLFTKVPSDWYLIATDIKNSTNHIENGKYKDINMIGALSIVSILNLNKSIEIPFVFGGDGAFILIPRILYKSSIQSMLAIKKLSYENYSLELRIGIIPIVDIENDGKKLLISKYFVSKDYAQAIIKGGGLDYADFLLKNSSKYIINDKIDPNFNLDIDGLECRWNSIKSPKNMTLSIIIKCFDEKNYEQLILSLENILGDDRSPISIKNLNLSFDNKELDVEASLFSNNILKKYLIKLKMKVINIIGFYLMNFKVGEWSNYKNRILNTSDTEKFDDTLRMVVSADFAQIEKLEDYLEKEYSNNNLVYGIHKSDSSLMTCLIFQRHGRHIHFVDGSNGGYSSASKAFKKRLKNIKENL